MYFLTSGLRKTWLDKCLKSPVSEDPSTGNKLNELKHCSKLNGSTFNVFIDPSKSNSGWKSLSKCMQNLRTVYYFLTHWLSIRSILFWIETFYRGIFRSNYLRKEKYFLIFCFFCKFAFNFESFQRKRRPS